MIRSEYTYEDVKALKGLDEEVAVEQIEGWDGFRRWLEYFPAEKENEISYYRAGFDNGDVVTLESEFGGKITWVDSDVDCL